MGASATQPCQRSLPNSRQYYPSSHTHAHHSPFSAPARFCLARPLAPKTLGGRDWAEAAANRAAGQPSTASPRSMHGFHLTTLSFSLCVQPPRAVKLGGANDPPAAKRGPRCETHLHFVVNATAALASARPPCQPCQPMLGLPLACRPNPRFSRPAYPIDYGPSYAGTGASRSSP